MTVSRGGQPGSWQASSVTRNVAVPSSPRCSSAQRRTRPVAAARAWKSPPTSSMGVSPRYPARWVQRAGMPCAPGRHRPHARDRGAGSIGCSRRRRVASTLQPQANVTDGRAGAVADQRDKDSRDGREHGMLGHGLRLDHDEVEEIDFDMVGHERHRRLPRGRWNEGWPQSIVHTKCTCNNYAFSGDPPVAQRMSGGSRSSRSSATRRSARYTLPSAARMPRTSTATARAWSSE